MVRMMYRKAKKGVAEQYGVNISKKIIEKMQITDTDREVEVTYDEKEKVIKIRKREWHYVITSFYDYINDSFFKNHLPFVL